MFKLSLTILLTAITLYANVVQENTTSFREVIDNKNIDKAVFYLHKGIDPNALYIGKDFNKTELMIKAEHLVNGWEEDTLPLKVGLSVYAPYDVQIKRGFGLSKMLYLVVKGETKAALELIKSMEQSGDTVNKQNLLTWAVISNNRSMVENLLKDGQNINYISYRGTPLMIASCYGYSDLVRYLLDKGADVGVSALKKEKNFNQETRTEIQNYYPIMKAFEKNNDEIVKLLLQYKPKMNKATYYECVLASAVKYSNVETVEFLIPKVADLNGPKKGNSSYLESAFYAGQSDIYYLLLKKGVNKSFLQENNIHPLLEAVALNDKKKFEELIKTKSGINDIDKSGKTALLLSIELNRLQMSKDLIKNGADVNLMNPILSAVSQENKELVVYLIDKGADLTVSEEHLGGVVSISISKQNLELVKLFVELGVSVNGNSGDKENQKPIEFALKYADTQIMNFLIKNGIDLNDEIYIKSIESSNVEVMKLLISQLSITKNKELLLKLWEKAISFNNLDALKALVGQGIDPNIRNEHHENALMCLSKSNNIAAISYMLTQDIDVNAVNDKGMNALHFACQAYRFDGDVLSQSVVQFLVEAGVYIDLPDNDLNTPLMYAARNGHYKIVQYLMSKNASTRFFRNTKGEDTLALAIRSADVKTINLIEGIKELKIGKESLFLAAESGDMEELKRQLSAGVDINSIDEYGSTALMKALYKHEYAVSEYLIDKGAALNTLGTNGLSPVHILIQNGYKNHIKLLEKLLKNGADSNLAKLESRWDLTPLMRGAEDPVLVDLLLKYGVDIRQVNSAGLTAFYYSISSKKLNKKLFFPEIIKSDKLYAYFLKAAECDNIEVLQFLLENGVNINILSPKQNSALHRAVIRHSKNSVNFLINHGINVNQLNQAGDTALHLAILFKKAEYVRLLVDSGADKTIKNAEGLTALNLASKKKESVILEILNEKK